MTHLSLGAIAFLAALATAGCVDKSPPPPRVNVPMNASEGPVYRTDPVKPMPSARAESELSPRPFDDVALVNQEIPEQRAFVSTYNAVGRPALMVTMTELQTSSDNLAVVFQFTEWLRCGGRVTILDPVTAKAGSADVLIYFAVAPPPQEKDSAMRLSARAVNARDQVVLAHAMVDVSVPADRQAINRHTRFLARKLMDGMAQTWSSAPPAAPAPPANPQPRETQPVPAPEEAPAARPPVPPVPPPAPR